jgi:hypothetical protein
MVLGPLPEFNPGKSPLLIAKLSCRKNDSNNIAEKVVSQRRRRPQVVPPPGRETGYLAKK